jgi:hypothetical protein
VRLDWGRREDHGRSLPVSFGEENRTSMTTNLLSRKSKQAIGEVDAHIFSCPACARPLNEGTSQCPGCGTRLIMGVMVKRAAGILTLGIVLGVLAGGATTAAVVSSSVRESRAAVVTPSSAPATAVSAAPTMPVDIPPAGAPQAAVAALSGTAVVNGRIALDAATLSSTLASKGASTIDIARALRSLAADAALGIDLAARLGSWHDAEPVMTDLDTFYRSMADTARLGLQASFTDNLGYRSAGKDMLTVLAGLDAVDAASRTLATTVDLELAPVAFPGAKAGTLASPAP